jgi:hypothetical protein
MPKVTATTTNGARTMPIETAPLLPGAGAPMAWAEARDRLETAELYRTYWLTTLHRDGHPHAMPVLGLWLDGAFFFLTSEVSRKGRNLANDARCVLTVSITSLPALDISAEGTAASVTDDATIRRVVEAYGTELHWPLTVEEDGIHGPSAPTAGSPPYAIYELVPATVFGLPGVAGTNEQGVGPAGSITPTRWRFDPEGTA